MNEKKKTELIAKLKKTNPDETAELCAYYENTIEQQTTIIKRASEQKKRDDARIEGLMIANVKARRIDKQIFPKIPKNYKPHRAGGNPETN